MSKKLSLLIGFGAGYMVGARAGRERYDQIVAKAQQLWRDPRVQEKTGQAQQLVQEKAGQARGVVQEKVASATASTKDDSSEQVAPSEGTLP